MTTEEWAEREIELACKKENPTKVEYVDNTKTIYKMTDLEALDFIVVDLTPTAKMHNREEIEQIKKSLEVLDIIKFLIKKGDIVVNPDLFVDYPELYEWLEQNE